MATRSFGTLVSSWQAQAPRLLSLLRIVAAFTFLLSGSMKLFAFPIGMPPDGATAPLLSQAGLGGVLARDRVFHLSDRNAARCREHTVRAVEVAGRARRPSREPVERLYPRAPCAADPADRPVGVVGEQLALLGGDEGPGDAATAGACQVRKRRCRRTRNGIESTNRIGAV